jgi:DNA modification methylase
MWCNKGETVYSPFSGIGSEGYQSLKMGRKFIGVELKESYHNIAIENLKSAILQSNQLELL